MKLFSSLQYGLSFDSVNNFDENTAIHIYDVFDQHYLDQLFASKGQPAYVVADHFSQFANCYCVPLFLEHCANKFVQETHNQQIANTKHCFNFQINKKQVNRFLCMKLVEFFNLEKFDYTWSGVDNNFDMSAIIQEMNALGSLCPISPEQRGKILSPVSLPKKFVFAPNTDHANKIGISNQVDVPWVWQNALQNIFYTSAVSLITESLSFQKATVFTEKTVYSVLGLTFPLWIGGGHEQATQWKLMGFDIFDDVINHDYQHYDTLIERCYYAFELNLPILINLELAQKTREKYLARLIDNRKLLLSDHLKAHNNQIIHGWPANLQSVMPEIARLFRI